MRRYRLGAVVAIGLLAACGGSDDDSAGENAGDASASDASASDPDSVESGEGGADRVANDVEISAVDEIPEECRRILGDFLRQIEPVVSGVDWQNATMADLDGLGTAIEAPSAEIEVEMERSGCNDIEFAGGADAGFLMSLRMAEQEAPGAVAWLEFVRDVSGGFDSSTAVVESAGDPEDDPEDCNEAIMAVRELMSQTPSMMELPVDEMMSAGSALQAVPALCSIDEMGELLDDPEFLAWSKA